MYVECTKNNGKDYLRLVKSQRIINSKGKKTATKKVVLNIGPLSRFDDTLEVDVTHYCACAKCCGKYASGNTASGKKAAPGMVAMSSHYPFGTLIEINGTMYTVEDRGGTGIENDIHRVDIFVPDHAQALRMGRYKTTAKIYRPGR